ncbi:hypothetical protein ACROYT_G012531 [Oculina patagonica]
MLVTLSRSRTEEHNAFKEIISHRNSSSFIETTHHYLRIQQILQTDFVYDAIQCALTCLVKTECISFNFRLKADLKGKHLCRLLASDKFKYSTYLQPSAEFHHYSIWSPCEHGVCKHGSTCLPLYETHGFVCHCVTGYTGIYCDNEGPVWLKVNTKEVCFGARDNSYGSFTMQYSDNIVSFKLVHLRGQISCHVNLDSLYSTWSCEEGNILQTFVTNASNAVVFPQLSGITDYRIPGIRSDSPELTFNNLTVPLRVTPGQEFRVWYKEDLKDVSEVDNGGQTCMDIYSLVVSIDGGSDEDIKVRINKARVVFNMLRKVWTSHVISRGTKFRTTPTHQCKSSPPLWHGDMENNKAYEPQLQITVFHQPVPKTNFKDQMDKQGEE